MNKTWVTVLMVLFASPLARAGEEDGTVSGWVRNGTGDSTGVPNEEVVLYRYAGGKKEEGFSRKTRTDDTGYFRFDGLPVGEGIAYYPVALHDGVEYAGDQVDFSSVSSPFEQQSDIVVYESTSSDSAISVPFHHIIISPDRGVADIREVLFFANRGNRTYVGSHDYSPGKPEVLDLEIPVGSTGLALDGDIMTCCIIVDGNRVIDTMELKPGARRVIADYRMPYKGSTARFRKTIGYATGALDLFVLGSAVENVTVQPPGGEPASVIPGEVETTPSFKIRGRDYTRYSLGEIPGGSMVTVTFRGMVSTFRIYRWLAPAAVILLMVAVSAYHRMRSKSEDSLTQSQRRKVD
ncbi:MAG: carboxypeptidase-like regulatory domain-containing protein [Fidelibacterota bacterium]